ncbi:MAG TPA: glucose dehydrogenase, partial [Chloroflexota bacterium]|nr:glucose dehydrogenase [Chloroflexota bacterium]
GSFVPPVAVYHHALGCAVVGGDVYRGAQYPALNGIYFFSDYCNGTIWGLRQQDGKWQQVRLLEPNFPVTGIGTDESGEIYLADYVHGGIDKLVGAPR